MPWLVGLCAGGTWLLLRAPRVAERIGLFRVRKLFAWVATTPGSVWRFVNLLFLTIPAAHEAGSFIRKLLTERQNVVSLFTSENRDGLGGGTIGYVRDKIAPRSVTPCRSGQCWKRRISIFAPVYTVPFPIMYDAQLISELKKDEYLLFNSSGKFGLTGFLGAVFPSPGLGRAVSAVYVLGEL
jgi:hypothetical protein